jgi:hypothetical protein
VAFDKSNIHVNGFCAIVGYISTVGPLNWLPWITNQLFPFSLHVTHMISAPAMGDNRLDLGNQLSQRNSALPKDQTSCPWITYFETQRLGCQELTYLV